MSEMIDVWEVDAHLGSCYFEKDPGQILDMIKDMDDGSNLTITKTKMEKGRYESLPEFTGF